MADYSGDDITIEEMPQGCVISGKHGYVIVSSTMDALALMKSLKDMLESLPSVGLEELENG